MIKVLLRILSLLAIFIAGFIIGNFIEAIIRRS